MRPSFIGAATQSISIGVTSGGTGVASTTINVTPTSAGCSTSAGQTMCEESLPLAPGSYIANVTSYDGLNGSGNQLAETQALAFNVIEGVANAVPVTLYGVPHSITVAAGSSTTTGSQSAGFTVYTGKAQTFTITATDADGETIVGPGAPVWTVAASTGSGFTLTAPGTSNSFSLIATTNDDSEVFSITASFADGTVCSQAGSLCSASISVKHQQIIFFVNSSSKLVEMLPPYTSSTSLSTVTGSTHLASDDFGDLFIETNSSVIVMKPPYTSTYTTISHGSYSFGVDEFGNVFVGGKEYSPPYTSSTSTIFTNSDVYATCGMRVANAVSGTSPYVVIANSPYATPLATASPGTAYLKNALAFNQNCDLAFGTFGKNYVTILAAPSYTSETDIALSNPSPVLFDSKGDLFAGASNKLYEFVPPFSSTSTPTTTINGSGTWLQMDVANDLFAQASSTLYEYQPPYSSSTLINSSLFTSGTFALTP